MSFTGFTIVIATCGRPDRLEHALTCIARSAQLCGGTHRIILADNHPAHSALPVAERLRSQLGCELIYLQTPPWNKCSALNAALRTISDGWIAFTDDDTEPQEGWLRAGRLFVESGVCRIFGGRVDVGRVEEPVPWHLKEKGSARTGGGGIFVKYAPLPQSGLLEGNMQVPLGANLFVRKDVFDEHGGYNEALWEFLGPKALGVDDGEFGIRLQKASEKIGYCHEAVVVHPCYAEKYELRRRIRNVYAYGWRTPILFPEDAGARVPRHALRMGVVGAFRGVTLLARGRMASGMGAILEAIRDYGMVASCVADAPRKAAGLLQIRCNVEYAITKLLRCSPDL